MSIDISTFSFARRYKEGTVTEKFVLRLTVIRQFFRYHAVTSAVTASED